MANKMKDTMDPRLWFKSEKDKKIAIAKRDLEGAELEKELATTIVRKLSHLQMKR